jgi:hypothetical protein
LTFIGFSFLRFGHRKTVTLLPNARNLPNCYKAKAGLATAWAQLPEHIRRAILALVDSVK